MWGKKQLFQNAPIQDRSILNLVRAIKFGSLICNVHISLGDQFRFKIFSAISENQFSVGKDGHRKLEIFLKIILALPLPPNFLMIQSSPMDCYIETDVAIVKNHCVSYR